MQLSASVVTRLPLIAALLVGTGAAAGSALAQADSVGVDCSAMHFEIANPTPGSRLDPGSYVVQGVAVDTSAEDGGPGIDTVDLFLGSRDAGGVIVGHAVPTSVGALAPDSFQTTITLPHTAGPQELFGYAHSTVTGDVSVVSVPIAVGVDPNKAGDVLSRPPVTECRPGTPVSAASDTGGDVQPADMAPPEEAPADTGAVSMPDNSTMYLDVANPSAGDVLHVGAYTLEGIAFDSASDSGPGIDHIDIFLDDRNAGGRVLGHASLGSGSIQPDDPNLAGAGWSAQIALPARSTGSHTLFFYALSSATGAEMSVGVPVQVVP